VTWKAIYNIPNTFKQRRNLDTFNIFSPSNIFVANQILSLGWEISTAGFRHWSGTMSDFIVYPNALSDGDCTIVANWLINQRGISL
jgi:hypothetical protein